MFNVNDVRDALSATISKVGRDYVYPESERLSLSSLEDSRGMCQYLNESGEPSCLVARAVRKLIPNAEFSEFRATGSQPWAEQFDDRALTLLQKAQGYQDNGYTWSDALYRATMDMGLALK